LKILKLKENKLSYQVSGSSGTGTEDIKSVCENYGYGNVMSTASILWQKKLGRNAGSAYSVGPCIASLVPCGCKDDFKTKCNWCAGTGKLTKHVKSIKDSMENKKHEPSKYEIEKFFVVSIAHISSNDNDGLQYATNKNNMIEDQSHPCNIVVYQYEFGWFVWIDPQMTFNDYKGYSNTFKRLIIMAKKLKCQYLKIDQDGPQYDNFEIFDW